MRPQIGEFERSVAWLALVAVLARCLLAPAAALGMWAGTLGPAPFASELCGVPTSPGSVGDQDQGSGHPAHDHEHCLLCNAGAIHCLYPVVALPPVPLFEPPPPARAPEAVTLRELPHSHAARGPPELA